MFKGLYMREVVVAAAVKKVVGSGIYTVHRGKRVLRGTFGEYIHIESTSCVYISYNPPYMYPNISSPCTSCDLLFLLFFFFSFFFFLFLSVSPFQLDAASRVLYMLITSSLRRSDSYGREGFESVTVGHSQPIGLYRCDIWRC